MNARSLACGLVLAFSLMGCSQNESIPKLVDLESFDSGAEEQFIGSAVNYTTPKLDILFVIDESGSMSRYQASLADNIDLFLDGIQKVDRLSYRIAVVTSGSTAVSGSVPYPGGVSVGHKIPLGTFYKKEDAEPDYISNTTRDGMILLRERLMPGDRGHATEKFFEPLFNALTMPAQVDFVRPDAYLAIFFLTDAEDTGQFIDASSLYDRILAMKNGNKDKVLAYGALVPAELTSLPSGCTRDDQGAPVNIEEFIRKTGGRVLDICSSDYGAELARVGQDLGEAVGSASALTEIPAPDTIRVYAGSRELPNDPYTGWMYVPETNEIAFGPGLEVYEGENIRVTYTRANQFRQ